jgi:hypothetical protein
MNTDPDRDNFAQVRRLLALKRHEQPPPGYFHSFSTQVIVRIRAGETGGTQTWWQRFMGETPWFDRIFGGLEVKPAFAGALSFGVCGLIATGLFYSETPTNPNLVGSVPSVFQADNLNVVQTEMTPATNMFLTDLPPALRQTEFLKASAPLGGAPRVQTLKWTY